VYPIAAAKSMQALDPVIRRCLEGDQQSYEALYYEFAGGIYRLCYSILLNRQDAEDIAQETFVYAFKNLQRYDPQRAGFKTWLYTIAISRCRNMYRRQRPALMDIAQMLQLPMPGPKSESPEAVVSERDAQSALVSALASLTPRLREAIVLRYGHGLMYREMAAVMDCPQKTAESRVRLAHNALRGLLQADGPGLLEELLSHS
jgi:RNA polymerase sigma-70 factor (ECF subfamily)